LNSRLRLPGGGRIDRTRPCDFTFDGRAYRGYVGDSLASALLANGVHLVARSFKYHRPRGIFSAGAEEPNALVRLERDSARETPNLRATQIELYPGLCAWSQNRWPSLTWDAGALAGLFSSLIPAGFYYKTFIGPRWLRDAHPWSRVFEPLIRRAAGLGRAPSRADPDTYLNRYAHCDVLVIGAGPAGIAAAESAAAGGADVILCDEQAEPGGTLLAEQRALIDDEPAAAWLAGRLAGLVRAGVRVLPRTVAFGYYSANLVGLCERLSDHLEDAEAGPARERLWQVRAREVVIATGAIERPLIFPHNDRPAIMLADAARTYVNRYAVKPGERAVIATACDSAYAAALDLHAAGVEIAVLCDLRATPPEDMLAAAAAAGIRVLPATQVLGTHGGRRVTRVRTGPVGAHGAQATFACDVMLMSGGWTPSVHLFSQSRGSLLWHDERQAYVPGASAQRERSAGACRGLLTLERVIDDGYAAGSAALQAVGHRATPTSTARVRQAWPASGGVLGARGHGKAFVDFQNDVTVRDIELAVREGFSAIEHVKRYTTTGMATDQGKTSGLNGLAIVAACTGRSIADVGLTTFRQPYTPITFGALAGTARGDLYDPLRVPVSHAWAETQGAGFEDVGRWRRARCFPRPGEDAAAAVIRECETVRGSVGLLDSSTLGKIDVTGPDAAEFLDRIYVNSLQRLAVGRCRYVLLLNEAGFVIDDGIVARLAADRFHVTTTTGGADRVIDLMEDYLQTEWPTLRVWLTPITEQWVSFAVQGPQARSVLAEICSTCDLGADRLPHMGIIEAEFAGVPARILRVSFTGELGFEVNVGAGYGADLWLALTAAVGKYGGCVYGTDAMHVLRAEKGYVIVGQDTDGTVIPDDLGLGALVGKTKRDFVGKRSLVRAGMQGDDRRQLVALVTSDTQRVLDVGMQVTAMANPPVGTSALGFVSSAYYSPALGRSLALALVAGGRHRTGGTLFVSTPTGSMAVELVPAMQYDPDGARLHG